MKYSAKDFENAKFAEHPDGRLAHRINHADGWSWAVEDLNGNRDRVTGNYMIRLGWVPVPTKPTITESEYRKGTGNFSAFNRVGFDTALRIAGVEVIPDPEPTNTEKLAALIKEVQGVNYGWIAKHLNDHGVTAPNMKDN